MNAVVEATSVHDLTKVGPFDLDTRDSTISYPQEAPSLARDKQDGTIHHSDNLNCHIQPVP